VTRHLLDLSDLDVAELDAVVALAVDPRPPAVLAGSGVAMVFEKSSNRTRNSTEMAVVALGGHPLYIQGHEVGLDVRESAEDVARTLAAYHRVLCARVVDHQVLVRMAAALDAAGAGVPVVNLLSDRSHPCQAVGDLITLRELLAPGSTDPLALAGRRLAYVGDANNVCRSLAQAGAMSGLAVTVASPPGYDLGPEELAELDRLAAAAGRGGSVRCVADPVEAVAGADAVYTDVWTSMGQEDEAETRRAAFAAYQVDEALLEAAGPAAVLLHCLPAHRGEEVTAGALEGPRSAVWRQAAHRRTAMVGILSWLTGPGALG